MNLLASPTTRLFTDKEALEAMNQATDTLGYEHLHGTNIKYRILLHSFYSCHPCPGPVKSLYINHGPRWASPGKVSAFETHERTESLVKFMIESLSSFTTSRWKIFLPAVRTDTQGFAFSCDHHRFSENGVFTACKYSRWEAWLSLKPSKSTRKLAPVPVNPFRLLTFIAHQTACRWSV